MSGLSSIFNWFAGLDPRIWQAVVAGTFVAGGWLVNGRQNRKAAERLRAEKLRDAHRAIFAEIATNLSNLWDEDTLRDHADDLITKMENDETFIPFIPKERTNRLFENIQHEINILPRITIDPIVRYYNQLDAIEAIVDDMRSDTFAQLSPERRIAIYEDYVDMRIQAQLFGQIANSLIAIYAAEGKRAAELAEPEIVKKLSSPRAGRSDP